MNYGNTNTEKIKVIKAKCSAAYENYKFALSMLSVDHEQFADPSYLKLLIEKCEVCQGALFSAFEVALRILTNNISKSEVSHHILNLRELSNSLVRIADPGSNLPKINGTDYTLVNTIDLSRIITTKEIRNDLTHEGVIREIRHYSTLFKILEKLVRILDKDFILEEAWDNNKINSISYDEIVEDFIHIVERFETPYCAYVLLLDSTWGIPQQKLDMLLSLNWQIIIDLDGRGIGRDGNKDKSRAEKALTNIGIQPIPFYARNFDINSLATILTPEKKPYLNFSDGGIVLYNGTDHTVKKLRANSRKLRSQESIDALNEQLGKVNALKQFIKQYLGEKYVRCTLVTTAEVDKGQGAIGEIIEVLGEKYEQDIRMLFVQDTHIEDKWPEWYTGCTIDAIDCESEDFFNALFEKLDVLPTTIRPQEEAKEGYWIPTRDKTKQFIPRNHVISNAEEYFEILHLGIGSEDNENDVELFYRGDFASWSAINKDCAADIVQEDRRSKFENTIYNSFTNDRNHAYYILHEPGCGGTTLGRQIAWNIHFKVPVVRLKHYDRNVANRINDLYSEFLQTPFLILIDSAYDIADENIEAMEKLLKMQASNLPPVVGLFVKRCNKRDSITREGSSKLILSSVTVKNHRTTIKSKCLEYARRLYPNYEVLDRHLADLDINIKESEQLPMIINMYIMDEQFKSPEQYVKSFISNVESVPDDTKKALIYISIYSYYVGGELPGKFAYTLCNHGGGRATHIHLRTYLSQYEKLLLYKDDSSQRGSKMQEPMAVKCRHFLFAREILRVFLGEHWKRRISEYVQMLVDDILNMPLEASLTDVISQLFARKDVNADYSGMTKIVTEVMNAGIPNDGITLLNAVSYKVNQYIVNHPDLKNKSESDDRHIFALLARLWAQCAKFYRKIEDDQDKMDEYTLKSLRTLNVDDDEFNREFYDLYHMAGICIFCKLQKKFECLPAEASDEEFILLQSLYNEAITYLKKSSNLGNKNYSLPWLIRTYELVVRYMFSYLNLKDNYRPELLDEPQYEWVGEVIDDATNLIDSCDNEDYVFDEDGKDSFEEAANIYRKTYLFGDTKAIREKLQNSIDRKKINGASGKSIQRTYQEMIEYTLSNYRHDRQVDYIALTRNKDDFDKLVKYVDEALIYSSEKSHSLFRLWFKLAKLRDASFTEAKQHAQDWAAVPVHIGQYMVWPYYYSYIIALLSGQPERDVQKRWDELYDKFLSRGYGKIEHFCDYYHAGKTGIGCLEDREWVQFDNIVKNPSVSTISGRIVSVAENEASGWINTSEVKYLDRKYPKSEGHVFFVPKSAKISNSQRREDIQFKFGFTLKRIQAINKSIHLLNEPEPSTMPMSVVNYKDEPTAIKKKQARTKSGPRPDDCVIFEADYISTDFNTNISYLNGNISGQMSSISTEDIQQFDGEINIYGSSYEVLMELQHLKKFYVIEKSVDYKGRHRVSVYNTNQTLADILSGRNSPPEEVETKPEKATELKKVALTSEKMTSNIDNLPDFDDKTVDFIPERDKGKGLQGSFIKNGMIYMAIIPTGVSNKDKRLLLKNHTILKTTIISKSKDYYILKKK